MLDRINRRGIGNRDFLKKKRKKNKLASDWNYLKKDSDGDSLFQYRILQI